MSKGLKLIFSLSSLIFSVLLMTFAVFAASSHTLTVKTTVSFSIEDNIAFNLTANAYHGNYLNNTLTKITDYTDRTDEPTSFNGGNTLSVEIAEKTNPVLDNGWAPFSAESGLITLEENSLIWEFLIESTSQNNIKADIVLPEYLWEEEIKSSNRFEIVTLYSLGASESEFDEAGTEIVKTTTLKKFIKIQTRLTVHNSNVNINLDELIFTLRICNENVVMSDVSMFSFATSGNTAEITSANLDSDVNTVVIPETINGYTVTRIASTSSTGLFANNTKIKEVVLPETVTEITNNNQTTEGSGVFDNCANLEEINLENVENLSPRLFYGCTNLKSVELCDTVTKVPDYCFEGCTNLEKINLDNITSTGNRSFRDCQKLKSVNLSSVTTLGKQTFRNCYALSSVTLPNNSYTMDQGAFYNCTSLKSIDVTKGTMSSTYTFYGCSALETVVLNSNQTTIPDYSFYNCINLKTINLQNAVSYGVGCFTNCENLSSFDGGNSTGTLEFKTGLTAIKKQAFENCKQLKTIVLPTRNSSLTLGESCFKNAGIYGEFNLPANYSLGDISLSGQFTGCPITIFTTTNTNYVAIDGVIYSADKTKLFAYPSGNTRESYEINSYTTSIRAGETEAAKSLLELSVGPTSSLISSGNKIYKNGNLIATPGGLL